MAARDAPVAARAGGDLRVPDERPLPIPMSEGGRAAGETPPTVSVVVATRERPDLLRRAVRSILEQDYTGVVECIVVADGGDPPDPAELAGGDATTRRLVVTTNGRTPGLAGARNAG